MKTNELVGELRDEILNRPEEDDLFAYPDDYYAALTRAERWIRDRIVQHYPDLLYTTATITSSDGGRTYALAGPHLGEIEVWTPPGPGRGRLLPVVLPESWTPGYYQEGSNIVLNHATVYTPGLYVRWIPVWATALSDNQDPRVPEYCRDALVLRAAYYMGLKPGFLGDSENLRIRARNAWSGDPDDPSDTGVLGIISRQGAQQSLQTAAGFGDDGAWWRGIPV